MSILELDKSLFFFINKTSANFLFDIIMPALSAKGYLLYLPYVLYIFFLGYKKTSPLNLRASILIIFIPFISFLITDWSATQMKYIIARQRPCNLLEDVRLLVSCTKSFSMPSNHAANVFSFTMASIYFVRKFIHKAWIFYLLGVASFIALSRVYVGVHYPSDILGGAIFGSFIAMSAVGLYRLFCTKVKKSNPY
ncbi:MAG: phosphatase PAP2 family protein [Nitrospirota bacterium]